MGVSQYTQQYGDPHKGLELPFQEMAMGAMAVEKRRQEGEAARQEAEDSFLNVHALDRDIKGRDAKIGQFKQQLQDIVDQNGGRYSEAVGKIKGLANTIKADLATGYLGAVNGSYNSLSKVQGEAQKMYGDKKITSAELYDSIHKPLTEFQGTKQNAAGGWDTFKPKSLAERTNFQEFNDTFIKGYAADRGATATADGQFIDKNTHKYVKFPSLQKDLTMAVVNHPSYANQARIDLQAKGYTNEHPLFNQAHTQYLDGLVRPYAHKGAFDEYDKTLTTNAFALKAMDKADDPGADFERHPTDAWANGNIANSPDPLKNTVFEGATFKNGALAIPEKSFGDKLKEGLNSPSTTAGLAGVKTSIDNPGVVTADMQKATFNKYKAAIVQERANNPRFKNMSDEAVIKATSEARNAAREQYHMGYSLGNLDNEKVSKAIFGSAGRDGFFNGRSVDILGEPGTGSLKDVLDKLCIDEKKLGAQLSRASINDIIPTEGGKYRATILDGNNRPVSLLISGSEEQKHAYNMSTQMSTLEKEGRTGTHEFEHNGEHMASVTENTLGTDGKAHFTTKLYGSKDIATKAETEQYLKAKGNTEYEERLLGTHFTQDGRVIRGEGGHTPEEVKSFEHTNNLNHARNAKYRLSQPKNTYNINESISAEE